MLHKFKTLYFDALINLYKQYDEYGFATRKTMLGLALLNTFIFLIKIDASEDVLKAYRAYFIMNNCEVPRNTSTSLQINILRGL